MTFPLPINELNVGIMASLGFIRAPELMASALAYWSANGAQASGGAINSVTGIKGRNLSKIGLDATRPTLTANRIVGTAAASSKLIEGGALQLLKLVTQSSQVLPDAGGSEAGLGFVCTGAVRLPNGTVAVMNFGLPVEGSGATPAPSIVILSADYTTKLAEFTFLSISGSLTIGAQGLGYDTRENLLFFWAANKFWFINPATGALVRTVDFTGMAVNGLAYDPATDMMVACPTGNNPTARWIDKNTGVMGASLVLYGTGVDHLCIVGNLLVYTGGDNGSAQGGAIRIAEISTGRIVVEFFTDATAPEGILVSIVNGVWTFDVFSDEKHHAVGATNLMRRFVGDPVPFTYPGAGRQYLMAFIGNLVSAPAGATGLLTVGEPTVSGARGTGLVIPGSGTPNTMLAYVNASAATFSGITTTTEALFVVAFNLNAANATLFMNGTLGAGTTAAISGMSSVAIYPPMQTILGATREAGAITRSSNSSFANAFIGWDISDRTRRMVEGELAWDAGRVDLLPAGHPYKTFRP